MLRRLGFNMTQIKPSLWVHKLGFLCLQSDAWRGLGGWLRVGFSPPSAIGFCWQKFDKRVAICKSTPDH
jgi:hypothetical protein